MTLLCLALAAIVALGGMVARLLAGAQARRPDASEALPVSMQLHDLPETADGGLTTAEIAQRVSPSVVSIHIYEQDSLSPSAMGSGVVLTQDGYIITNAPVSYTHLDVYKRQGTARPGCASSHSFFTAPQ